MLMLWIISIIASVDAQSTAKEMCPSVNDEHINCLMNYIDEKFEQLALKNEQTISDNIDEKLEELNFCDREQSPENCHDIYMQGSTNSGVYSICVQDCVQTNTGRVCQSGVSNLRVYCDMDNENGGPGWIVFQRRQDGSVNFTRDWNTYKHGFGDLDGELWLGNDNVAKILANGNFQLRVDLEDWEGERRYAEYSFIRVHGEEDKYQLFFGDYSGNAGDAFTALSNSYQTQNGTYFSTIDRDNDRQSPYHCALHRWNAGFWYSNCGYAGLNNPYHVGGVAENGKGIMWNTWHGPLYSMKSTVMKLRPVLN